MSGRASLILVVLVAGAAVAALALGPAAVPSAQAQPKAKYKGSEACKMCHDKVHEKAGYNPYQAWKQMKHSRAFAALNAEQVASGKDPQGRACVQCHTTGYGKGGFVSAEKTPKLTNVGCEACHGPGSLHIMTMAMADEGEEIADKKIGKGAGCTQCHNPHVSYKKLYGGK